MRFSHHHHVVFGEEPGNVAVLALAQGVPVSSGEEDLIRKGVSLIPGVVHDVSIGQRRTEVKDFLRFLRLEA